MVRLRGVWAIERNRFVGRGAGKKKRRKLNRRKKFFLTARWGDRSQWRENRPRELVKKVKG